MKNRKKDIIQFSVWMRNGIAFCTAWILILILVYSHVFNHQTILINNLTKMVLLITGGVFIFCLFFTRLFIRRWSFVKRLTCFITSIILYECAGFYWIGFFAGKGTFIQWIIFVGIAVFLYSCCILLYQRYNKKQGAIYTHALQNYQEQRSIDDEE